MLKAREGSTREGMVPKLKFRRVLRILLTKMTHDISCMIRGTYLKSSSHACATNKFKVQFESINSSSNLSLGFYSPSRTRSPTSFWILVQSFCYAQNPSAVGSYCRSDSSTAITFSRLHINQLYIVLQSDYSLACHVLLVRGAHVRGMTRLNVCIPQAR
jgi:hypothetical protein